VGILIFYRERNGFGTGEVRRDGDGEGGSGWGVHSRVESRDWDGEGERVVTRRAKFLESYHAKKLNLDIEAIESDSPRGSRSNTPNLESGGNLQVGELAEYEGIPGSPLLKNFGPIAVDGAVKNVAQQIVRNLTEKNRAAAGERRPVVEVDREYFRKVKRKFWPSLKTEIKPKKFESIMRKLLKNFDKKSREFDISGLYESSRTHPGNEQDASLIEMDSQRTHAGHKFFKDDPKNPKDLAKVLNALTSTISMKYYQGISGIVGTLMLNQISIEKTLYISQFLFDNCKFRTLYENELRVSMKLYQITKCLLSFYIPDLLFVFEEQKIQFQTHLMKWFLSGFSMEIHENGYLNF
jgi:hypothetical protein